MQRVFVFAGLALVAVLALVVVGQAPRSLAQAKKEPTRELQTVRSTVWIIAEGDVRVFAERDGVRLTTSFTDSGSGVVIDVKRRLVLTTCSAVGKHEKAAVVVPGFVNDLVVMKRDFYVDQVLNGNTIRGKVIAKDAERDLVVLQLASLPKVVQAVRLAADPPPAKEAVHAAGVARFDRGGPMWSFRSTTVSKLASHSWRCPEGPCQARTVEIGEGLRSPFSGGPVVNDRGELVGITLEPPDELLGFSSDHAIDVREIRDFLLKKKVFAPSDGAAEKSKPR